MPFSSVAHPGLCHIANSHVEKPERVPRPVHICRGVAATVLEKQDGLSGLIPPRSIRVLDRTDQYGPLIAELLRSKLYLQVLIRSEGIRS